MSHWVTVPSVPGVTTSWRVIAQGYITEHILCPQVRDSQNKMGREVEKSVKDKLVTLPVPVTLTQILLSWDFSLKRIMRNKSRKVHFPGFT